MRAAAIALGVLLIAAAPIPVPVPREKPQSVSSSAFATNDFGRRLAEAAIGQTEAHVTYDPSYERLAYPGGDVAPDKGVCADVVIRAYRALRIDLQVLVHRDMVRAFARYPHRWGLTRTDTNIDHRRVPNLETFFRRQGRALTVSEAPGDYRPGDLVSWVVAGSLPHIGIVTGRHSPDGARPLMVHNIGQGPKVEDVLFAFPITGHFRYAPGRARVSRGTGWVRRDE